MPTIELDKKDLEKLVGVKYERFEDSMRQLKCDPESKGSSKIGDKLKLEVEVTADRPDLWCVEGLANALRNYLGRDKLVFRPKESSVTFHVGKVNVRPKIACGIVKNVKVTEEAIKSLIQLQEKLHETYGRKRSKVAIGIHDMESIKPPFTYKEVEPTSKKYAFKPLDLEKVLVPSEVLKEHPKGREYGHIISSAEKYPVITDSSDKVFSFPPIINAERTRVTENTKHIFIDVTGLDDDVNYALNIIMRALVARGGQPYFVNMRNGRRYKSPRLKPKAYHVGYKEIESLLGFKISKMNIKSSLEKMGYKVDVKRRLTVQIPPYRADIRHNVDVIEDIAIGYGYNNIPPREPRIYTIGSENEVSEYARVFRELMIGYGHIEILSMVLTSKKLLKDTGFTDGIVELKNPISDNYNVLRTSVLPSLIEFLSKNTHREYPQKIFEVGDCVKRDSKSPEKTLNYINLGVLCAEKEASFNSAKAVIMGIFALLNKTPEFKPLENCRIFISGRAASITTDGEEVGIMGEIDPGILCMKGINVPTSGFEIYLEKLFEKRE